MHCSICDRNLILCICDDAETRIRALGDSEYLQIDWEGMLAVRELNKFDIARDKETAKLPKRIIQDTGSGYSHSMLLNEETGEMKYCGEAINDTEQDDS